jgi:hypothetical protein
MISNSSTSYLLIRASIFSLRLITPISILYTFARITTFTPSLIPLPLEIVAYAESAFYFLVYLPRRHVLQRPAKQGTKLTQPQRKELFDKCLESIPNVDYFLSVWFKGAHALDLRRDDVKEWLAWAFFNQGKSSECDRNELEEYVVRTEEALGWRLPPGKGNFKSMRPTIDPIRMQHRSLLYYLVSDTAHTLTFSKLVSEY